MSGWMETVWTINGSKYTLPHNSGRVLCFPLPLSICLPACLPIFAWFLLSNVNSFWWIYSNFAYSLGVSSFGFANGQISSIFIPHHTIVARYYGFTLDIPVCQSVRCTSIHPSIFLLRMITWININGFSPNLVCALILWISGLGLLMGKFRQIFTELSARDTPTFLCPDDNLSK